jgi:hypothetical protein
MADILLSNDDLTVFGGPETISLDLDIGPQGDRGSIIVGSNGNPQDTNVNAAIVQNIQALDIAIDYNPFSTTYKTVFQRVATATGTQWTEMFSLKTNFYSSVKSVTAVASGSYGIITIPPINVTEIYDISGGEVTSENFSVQYSISSPDSAGPVSTTLAVKDLVTSQGFLALPLEIKGVEYDGTTWGPMTGPKTVHLFITVV